MYSISINGIIYDRENLHTFPADEEWQKDIVYFLGNFFDPQVHEFSFHTSGTTGTPKEITFAREQLIRSAEITIRYFGLSSTSPGHPITALLCLPCKYVAGRMLLVRAVLSGMDVLAVPPSLDPLKDTGGEKIHFAAMTPAQVASSVHRSEFSAIDKVIIGAGALSAELENKLAAFPNAIYATYGMTETLTHVAVRRVGQEDYEALDASVKFSSNENGELEIEVPYLYTEKLITHDVVEIISRRRFRWLGRTDHIINSGGVKLYPEKMEQRIACLFTGKFYISSGKDAVLGEVPVLVCEQQETLPANILEQANALLGRYERLREIIRVPLIEQTETGKYKRRKF